MEPLTPPTPSSAHRGAPVRDEIPPLTRGLMLIDQLVQATMAHCRNPRNRMLAEKMAEVRTRAEKYTAGIEYKAGLYAQVAKGAGGRKRTKGWTVSRVTKGKGWRGSTTRSSAGSTRKRRAKRR